MKKLLKVMLAAIFVATAITAGDAPAANAAPQTIQNGTEWRDVNNASLQAHAGHIIKVGSTYYWYGEDKIHNSANFKAVTVYSSTDLKTWTWRSYALTQASHPELDYAKIERPKVIYNESTGRYVMWAHYEDGAGYTLARVAVASSTTPTGPFTYHGSFRPNNNQSRDMTVFKDTDGQAYLISSSDTNSNLRLYRLTSDYLGIAAELNMIYQGGHREAPAIVKQGNRYYLITSGASGWYPNQAMYSTATNINGPWSALQPLGNSSTFYTQPAFILTIQGTSATSHVYVGDRWRPGQLSDSRYVWLPLTLNGTSASLEYYDSISVDAVTGVVAGTPHGTLLSQGRPATAQSAAGSSPASYANDGNYQTEWVATGSTWPHWWRVDLGSVQQINNVQISWWMMNGSEGYYRYRIETSNDNVNWTVALDRTNNTTYGFTSDSLNASGRYVRINMVNAVLHNNPNNWYTPRLWEVKIYGGGSSGGGTNYVKLKNAATGLYADGMGRTENGSALGQWGNSSSTNQQWIIEPAGSYVKIKNRATGLYVDGMGRTSNGSATGQWGNSSSYNQQWQQVGSGSNVRFVNRETGLYLDGMGRTTNGSDVGQWSNSGSSNQQWIIETVN